MGVFLGLSMYIWLGTLIAGVSGHLDSELSNPFSAWKIFGGGKVSHNCDAT